MTSRSVLDYATPYEIMVGVWTGHSILYDKNGDYLHTGPSLLTIYWKELGKLMHFKQENLGNLDELVLDHPHKSGLEKIISTLEFDLEISGKACHSKGGEVQVEGVESQPGTYLFHLTAPEGHYYNNQYFQNPNERHIIGPYISNGGTEIGAVVAQTFSRISYNVPEEMR